MESSILTDRSTVKKKMNLSHHTKNSLSETFLKIPSNSIFQEQVRDYLKKDQEKTLPKLKLKHSRDVSYIRDLKLSKSNFNPISLPKTLKELKSFDTCKSFAQLSSLCNKSSCISDILTSRTDIKGNSVKYLQSLDKSLPSGRKEAENLLEWFKTMKSLYENDQDFEVVIWKCAEELCRQINVECRERGELFKIVFGYFQDIFDAKNEDIREYCENYENHCKKNILKLQALHSEEIGSLRNKVDEMAQKVLEKENKIEVIMQECIIYKQKFYEMRRQVDQEKKIRKVTLGEKFENLLKVDDRPLLKRSHKTQKSPNLSFTHSRKQSDLNDSFHAPASQASIQILEIFKEKTTQTEKKLTQEASNQINEDLLTILEDSKCSEISILPQTFIMKKIGFDKSVQANVIVPSIQRKNKNDFRQNSFQYLPQATQILTKTTSFSFLKNDVKLDESSSSSSESEKIESDESDNQTKVASNNDNSVPIIEYNFSGIPNEVQKNKKDKKKSLKGKRKNVKKSKGVYNEKSKSTLKVNTRKLSFYQSNSGIRSSNTINQEFKKSAIINPDLKQTTILSIPVQLPRQKSKSFLITTSLLPDISESSLVQPLEKPKLLSPITSEGHSFQHLQLSPINNNKEKTAQVSKNTLNSNINPLDNSHSMLEESGSSYEDLFKKRASSPFITSNIKESLKSLNKKLTESDKSFSLRESRFNINKILSKFIKNHSKTTKKILSFSLKSIRKIIYSVYLNSNNFEENIFMACLSSFGQKYGLKKVAQKKFVRFLLAVEYNGKNKSCELFLRLNGLGELVHLSNFSDYSKNLFLELFRGLTQNRHSLSLFEENKVKYYSSYDRIIDFIKLRYDQKFTPGTLKGFYEKSQNHPVNLEKMLKDLIENYENQTVQPIIQGISLLFDSLDIKESIPPSVLSHCASCIYPRRPLVSFPSITSKQSLESHCIKNLLFSLSDLQTFISKNLPKSKKSFKSLQEIYNSHSKPVLTLSLETLNLDEPYNDSQSLMFLFLTFFLLPNQ